MNGSGTIRSWLISRQERVLRSCLSRFSLTLSPSEGSIIEDILPVLEEEGFMIEPFGKETWSVRGVPVILGRCEDPGAVREIISAALSGDVRNVELLKERISKLVACRGAVKAGAVLTGEQCEELYETTCPDTGTIYLPSRTSDVHHI